MRYSQDLPLEEKQRLDQIHLKQGGVNPYGTDLNNENSGLNSMFPPRDKRGQLSVTKSPTELMEWARNERMNRRQKSPEEMAYYINIDETQGNPTVKDPAMISQEWQQEHPLWQRDFVDRGGRRPVFTSRPSGGLPQDFVDRGGVPEYRPEMIRPAVIQPPSITTPTPQPPKTGGPFGGGGKGGNFLNRFERLLDGLEGLVGKLGADGSTPESPFPTGDGGGLAEVIKTPFTPTQDY